MTRRLYYLDAYRQSFNAVVTRALEHDGRPAAVLDQSAFYPTSGGQPFDTGSLGGAAVVDVVDADGDVVHVLSAPLQAGATVRGEIDWPRRFDHMQQHTGQHVLSAAFDRLFGNRTVSFHMGGETSTIDLAAPVTAEEIERGVDEANRVVWEDQEVAIRFASDEEARAMPLRKESARQGELRLVAVGDFDLSACGGTHVSRTGAIGLIAVLSSERFKGGQRLTFVCGRRALRALRDMRDAVAGSVRGLSVLPSELPAAVARLQAEGKSLRKTIAGLQASLAVHEGERLLAASPSASDLRVIVETYDGWDANGLKAIASAVTAKAPVAVGLVSAGDPVLAVVACAPGLGLDAGALMRRLTERFGGRGGGRPDLAQAGGLTGSAAEIAGFVRALLTS